MCFSEPCLTVLRFINMLTVASPAASCRRLIFRRDSSNRKTYPRKLLDPLFSRSQTRCCILLPGLPCANSCCIVCWIQLLMFRPLLPDLPLILRRLTIFAAKTPSLSQQAAC